MISQYYGIAFLLFSFAASLASLYYSSRRKSSIIPLVASMAVSFIAAYTVYGSYHIIIAYVGVGMAALSTALAQAYVRKPKLFIALLPIIAAGFSYGLLSSTATIALAAMFAIGTMFGLLYVDFFESKNKIRSSLNSRLQVEVNRDVIHILIGVLVAAMVLLLPLNLASDTIFFLILAGYLVNNISGLKQASRAGTLLHSFYRYTASRMERMSTTFGIGAVYLAAGIALLIGVIHNSNFLLFSVIALLFADPAATIVGIRVGGPKLPYNRRKSAAGTMAFFIIAGFLGYLAIGYNAFIAAAILAGVESLDLFVDDNIRIAVICAAIYLLAYA